MKSFRPKDDDEVDGGDFHGEKRSNATHASTTDPDARLARKGQGFGFRDGDAAAKGFKTKYYNAHLHQGVLVAPPFVAEALGEAQG